MYFYELHEGDDDLMSDVILACETDVPRDEFLDMVRRARAVVEETFEEDTLVEAIAAELESMHGFVVVTDDRLVASVRIAPNPADDRLIGEPGSEDEDDLERDDELDDDELAELPDFLTIPVDFDAGTGLN